MDLWIWNKLQIRDTTTKVVGACIQRGGGDCLKKHLKRRFALSNGSGK